MSPYRDETPERFEACTSAPYCGACCNLQGGCPWKRLDETRKEKADLEKAEASALTDIRDLTDRAKAKKLAEQLRPLPLDVAVGLALILTTQEPEPEDPSELLAGQPDAKF